jgi:hypothetical protein
VEVFTEAVQYIDFLKNKVRLNALRRTTSFISNKLINYNETSKKYNFFQKNETKQSTNLLTSSSLVST